MYASTDIKDFFTIYRSYVYLEQAYTGHNMLAFNMYYGHNLDHMIRISMINGMYSFHTLNVLFPSYM